MGVWKWPYDMMAQKLDFVLKVWISGVETDKNDAIVEKTECQTEKLGSKRLLWIRDIRTRVWGNARDFEPN